MRYLGFEPLNYAARSQLDLVGCKLPETPEEKASTRRAVQEMQEIIDAAFKAVDDQFWLDFFSGL